MPAVLLFASRLPREPCWWLTRRFASGCSVPASEEGIHPYLVFQRSYRFSSKHHRVPCSVSKPYHSQSRRHGREIPAQPLSKPKEYNDARDAQGHDKLRENLPWSISHQKRCEMAIENKLTVSLFNISLHLVVDGSL